MNVFIAHNFYQQPGGEDQAVAAEVAMLRDRGHDVVQYFVHNEVINQMDRMQLAARTLWNPQTYENLRDLFRTHKPQIAHFHNTFPLISPAAYYAAKAENVRVVQTLHNFRLLCGNALLFRDGIICEDCVGRTLPWPGVMHGCYRGSRMATGVVAAMLSAHRAIGTWRNAVDVYVALTEGQRRKLIQGGLPGDRVTIKPNFVYPDPGPGSGYGGYGLFVGRLSTEKGIDTLVEAWRLLEGEVPLQIVGDGPELPLVQRAAAALPAVQWLGSRASDEVYSLMGEARFLVVPSRCYETFGRVIIEAFAKGTPVICSNIGAMAELVEDGTTGLHFNNGDAADLAASVRRMGADKAQLNRMRRAARNEFERKFTAAANHKYLVDIYTKVLSVRPGNG